MAGDGWKHLDLESLVCQLCGRKVKRSDSFEYRFVLNRDQRTGEGKVRHIACIASIQRSVATDA